MGKRGDSGVGRTGLKSSRAPPAQNTQRRLRRLRRRGSLRRHAEGCGLTNIIGDIQGDVEKGEANGATEALRVVSRITARLN